jgi:hypothetical protein
MDVVKGDLHPKLITYLKPLIEVNPMSMSIHIFIDLLSAFIFYKSQFAMWIHYWLKHFRLLEVAMTDG